MAHELDRKADGTGAMFSVGLTPWHREGVVLAGAPSFHEALRIGGLDYLVARRPLLYLPRGAKGPVETGTGYAIVRTDREAEDPRGAVLAITGDAYRELQNLESMESMEPLVDAGVAFPETGGVLRGGRDAWLLMRFEIKDPRVREVFADEVVPYGLVHANHGRRKTVLMETPVWVVCANTMSAAYRSGKAKETMVGIAHRGDARRRLVEAAEKMYGALIERYAGIAERYAALKERILTGEEFVASVMDVVAPLPPRGKEQTRRSHELAVARAEERRAALLRAWRYGKGHTGDGSAWEAMSGVAEVLDHDEELFKVKTSRAESLMTGVLAARKNESAAALVALAMPQR